MLVDDAAAIAEDSTGGSRDGDAPKDYQRLLDAAARPIQQLRVVLEAAEAKQKVEGEGGEIVGVRW